jgi:hypothetical protein
LQKSASCCKNRRVLPNVCTARRYKKCNGKGYSSDCKPNGYNRKCKSEDESSDCSESEDSSSDCNKGYNSCEDNCNNIRYSHNISEPVNIILPHNIQQCTDDLVLCNISSAEDLLSDNKSMNDMEAFGSNISSTRKDLEAFGNNISLTRKDLEAFGNNISLTRKDLEAFGNNISSTREDLEPSLPESISNNECCICFNNILHKIALVPCGHMKFCDSCIDLLDPKVCPLCKQNFV